MNTIINTSLFNYQQTKMPVKTHTTTLKKSNNCTDVFFCQNYTNVATLPIQKRFNNVIQELNKIVNNKNYPYPEIQSYISKDILKSKNTPYQNLNSNSLKRILVKTILNEQNRYKEIERVFAIDTYGKIYTTIDNQKILRDILKNPEELKNPGVIAKTIEVLGQNCSKRIRVVKSTKAKILIDNHSLKEDIRPFTNTENEAIRNAAKEAMTHFDGIEKEISANVEPAKIKPNAKSKQLEEINKRNNMYVDMSDFEYIRNQVQKEKNATSKTATEAIKPDTTTEKPKPKNNLNPFLPPPVVRLKH